MRSTWVVYTFGCDVARGGVAWQPWLLSSPESSPPPPPLLPHHPLPPSPLTENLDTPRASSRFPNAACSAPLPPAAQGIHSPRSQRRTQVHVQDDAGAAWRVWKGAREDAPIYWASVTQEWIAAAFHLRTQFGSEKGKCHPPHQTAMLSAILLGSLPRSPSCPTHPHPLSFPPCFDGKPV